MEDDEVPPAAPSRFPFLKRRTGSQKYNKINYLTPRKSSASQLRPSATSASSGYPSSSAYIDVNIPRGKDIPMLQLSPHIGEGGLDSGRGSAAPQEQIYAMPSNRSTESGYGGYRHSASPPSHQLNEALYNDFQNNTPSEKDRYTSRSMDDEVFLPNHEEPSPVSKSMQSFIRNEQAVEKEITTQSVMSTPTRELRVIAENRQSRPSQSSAPYYPLTDSDSTRNDDGPLSSTPIDFGSSKQPLTQIQQKSTIAKETPILESGTPQNGQTSDSSSGGAHSSVTSVPQSYRLAPPSDNSVSSVDFATKDRPLHLAFPPIREEQIETTPIMRPSASTQYHKRLPPNDDILRRTVLENGTKAKLVKSGYISTTSSDDYAQTPLRKILPKATDPVVKELRRQLRDSVAHMDLAIIHLKDQYKNVDKLKRKLEISISDNEERKDRFEEERNAWLIEQKRELDSFKKDRTNLQRREEEFRKKQSEADENMNKQTVANRQTVAQMRIQISNKNQEIKRLTEEVEAKEQMKVRLEKTLEQQRNSHSRELKKLREETAELQNRLTQAETLSTKRRNGLQARNYTKTSQSIASQTANRSLPFAELFENPHVMDPRRSQTLPAQLEHFPQEMTPRKQVQFNLDRNVVYNDISRSDLSLSDRHAFLPAEVITDLPTGICHPFFDEKDETTYMYELKHINSRICGAKIFRYPNNDAKWIYGPIELYLFHKFPLVIKLPCIDVVIRIFQNTVEIHREVMDYMEISKLDREADLLTELRRRKDSSGYYAIKWLTRTGSFSSIVGNSDRPYEEDAIALRRGTLTEPREYVDIKKSARGYDVYWLSKHVPSAIVKEYYIVSDASQGTKLEVTLQHEIINITACPAKDWLIIRHQKIGEEAKESCCDLGKPTRDRERRGEFVAIGNIVPR